MSKLNVIIDIYLKFLYLISLNLVPYFTQKKYINKSLQYKIKPENQSKVGIYIKIGSISFLSYKNMHVVVS